MIKLSYKLLSGGLVISILLHCKVGSPRGSTFLQIVLIMHKVKFCIHRVRKRVAEYTDR